MKNKDCLTNLMTVLIKLKKLDNLLMKLKPVGIITKNQNFYYYSYSTKNFYLTSPLLYKIIEIGIEKTLEIITTLKNGGNNSNYLGDSIEDIEYYLKKYTFWEENNIIKTEESCVVKNPTINENDLIQAIDNCENIVLEVTQKCNLKCIYCAYGFYYKKENNQILDLQYSDAITFIDFIIDRKIKKYKGIQKEFVIGFYGGEPLLKINLIKQVIKYIENKYSKYIIFKYRITTNGVLLNKHIKYLVEKKFRLSISLDGNKQYNSLRVFPNGKNSFDIVSKNIEYIEKEYPKYFKRNVFFLTVYHSKSNLKEIHLFFKEKYKKSTDISMLSETGIDESKRDIFYKHLYKTLDDDSIIMDDLNKNYIYPEVNYLTKFLKKNVNVFHPDIYNIHDYTSKKVRMLCSCIPFKNLPFLKTNGLILPCTEVGTNAKIGELKNGEIQIFNDEIIEKFNKFSKKLNKSCNRCYNFENCDFCIFRIEDKLWDQENIQCEEFLNYTLVQKFYKKLIELIEEKKNLFKRIFSNLYSYDEL